MTADATQVPKDLVGFLDYYLVRKAPFQLPDAVKEWLVRYGPWITVVLLVLTLPALLVALGLSAAFLPFAGIGYATGFTYLTVLVVAQCIMMALALPGLFARRMSGWKMLFYAQIVSVVGSLLSGSIVGTLVGALIGFYLLFQIRPLYHE